MKRLGCVRMATAGESPRSGPLWGELHRNLTAIKVRGGRRTYGL